MDTWWLRAATDQFLAAAFLTNFSRNASRFMAKKGRGLELGLGLGLGDRSSGDWSPELGVDTAELRSELVESAEVVKPGTGSELRL